MKIYSFYKQCSIIDIYLKYMNENYIVTINKRNTLLMHHLYPNLQDAFFA